MRNSALFASFGLVALALLGGAGGCSSDPPPGPAVKPAPTGLKLPGLEGAVEVIVDDRAMPHIYASSLHDAVMVQGYLMARDRYPQMELIKRNVTGRLAEFIGPLSPATVEDDIAARVIGFKRIADRIYEALPAEAPVKIALDAFAAGVNLHVAELRDGTSQPPAGAELIGLLINQPDVFTDWTPQDSLAIGRYLSHALSYSADEEVTLTLAKMEAEAAFPAGDPRAGIFSDFWSFAPARDVFTRDGFPNVAMDSGSRAVVRPPGAQAKAASGGSVVRERAPSAALVSAPALAKTKGFFAAARRLREGIGDESRGSNNWIVSGAKTASGSPLLANDPHLTLPSPPLFWYAHLSTKRAGGNLDVEGISLAGTPGVILGFNDQIAWGSTTANHDVTDVYEETITEGANGAPATVAFKGKQVPIEIVTETVKFSGGADIVIKLERVPHHGLIIPTIENGAVVPRTESKALSVRWTGDDVSMEFAAFLGLSVATNLEEARAALDDFQVGAQSFVVVTREKDIFWSTQARMPVRDPKAMAYDPVTRTGLSPAMVLPGDGSCEWVGDLEDRYIPHEVNPERGFIATANNDLVGSTKDGNPFNDPRYAGWDHDIGHRVARITERLSALVEKGGVTPEDMMAVQGDHRSPLGALLSPAFVAAARRAGEERAMPGTHADLSALVAGSNAADLDLLAEAADRLEAWSFETSAGVDIGDGEPPAEEVSDSIAAALFNASMLRVVALAFGDERAAIGRGPDSGKIAKVLQWAILEPKKLATYSEALGDTVLWDDLATKDEAETKDERIARGMLQAIAYLRDRLGADVEQWRWGRLHTLTLESIVPALGGKSVASIPAPSDARFPDGFPRPGDNFAVDVAPFGLWNPESFTYGAGPVQRLVVEMTPDGPRAWNALPGGQVFDPESKHHADEAEHWRRNEAPPLYFTEGDVNAHAESSLSFVP